MNIVNEHCWSIEILSILSCYLEYVKRQQKNFILRCYTFEINPEKDLLEWPVANNECTKLGMSLPVFNLIDTSESEWYNSKLLALDVYLEQVNAGFWIGAKGSYHNLKKRSTHQKKITMDQI